MIALTVSGITKRYGADPVLAKGGRLGGLYGAGVYLTDSVCKALQYLSEASACSCALWARCHTNANAITPIIYRKSKG